MRRTLLAAWLAFIPVAPALAYTSVSIGINIPAYPRLVPVPGYPVYYAPNVPYNYFFYDGMYWDFDGDNWYYSRWYNGPWDLVDPYAVPLFLLRVPVRYYHRPPVYFRGWAVNDAPRWHEHWGRSWSDRRHDWHDGRNRRDWNDGRNRRDYRAERAAPLPHYQRQYTQRNYPAPEQQRQLADRSYRYQPREQVVQQHYRGEVAQVPQQQVAPQPQRGDARGQGQGRGEGRGEGRHEGRGHTQER